LGGRGWRWVGGGHGAAILCACGCRGFSFGHVGAAKNDGAIGYGLVLREWLQRVFFWACRAAKGDGANGYGLVGLEERSRLASGYGQEGWRSRNNRNWGVGGKVGWVEVGVGLVAASVMGHRDGTNWYGLVLRVWLQRASFWACRAVKGDGTNGYGLVGLEERSRLASGYGQEGWRSLNKGTGGVGGKVGEVGTKELGVGGKAGEVGTKELGVGEGSKGSRLVLGWWRPRTWAAVLC
jgi:hypothetical protein